MINYSTPIRLIQKEIEYQMENEILKAVQRYDIDVNKDELMKALKYDRNQYEKGYQDGLNANKWIPCSERLPEMEEYDGTLESYRTHRVLVSDGESVVIAMWDDGFRAKDYTMFSNVIAWKPLPEPYKEGES